MNSNIPPTIVQLSATVPDDLQGARLDQAAHQLFPEYSRARLQQWIESGELLLNGKAVKAKSKVIGGETVTVDAQLQADTRWEAQQISLDVVYEDDSLLVINKPVGLIVHPGAGNPDGTMLNALLHHCPALAHIPRAGIVHRIDKETSGLLVVAKTLTAHTSLVDQLAEKTVTREYDAVVVGAMTGGGVVDARIGRHPTQRIKMAVTESGKMAVTHYRIAQRFRGHTHVKCFLETGRTHQIRVHMAYIGYPLVGDPVYGGRLKLPKSASPELVETLNQFKRQALHASKLELMHPETGEDMVFTAPLPEDIQKLLEVLKKDDKEHARDAFGR